MVYKTDYDTIHKTGPASTMMACSSNNPMKKDVALTNIPMAKLYHWRMALFYSVLPIGEVESMAFYFHPTYTPDEKIRKLITFKGGCVIDRPNDDPFTVILVNTKAENFNADTQLKEQYDLFDSSFIENCVENRKLVDLNSYRVDESSFEEYDANQILNRRLKWETMKKNQVAFQTSASSAFVKIVSTTESAEEDVLSNTPNKNAEASSIPNLPSTSSNVLSLHKNNVPKTVVQSPHKTINELSRPSQPLATEINSINSTPSKNSSQPVSSQKKRHRVRSTNYFSDTSSTSSSVGNPPPPKQRKSYPRQRLSQLSLQPSADGRRYKSLPNNGQSPLNITKVFENLTALSRNDLYGRSKEKDVPLTRNKTKSMSTSAHKSSIRIVEKDVTQSKNTKSPAETSSSEEVRSTSKTSVEISKPVSSATNATISIVDKNVSPSRSAKSQSISPSRIAKSQSISPASLKELAFNSQTSVVLSKIPSSVINRIIPTVEKIATRSMRTNSQPEKSFSVKEASSTSKTSRTLSERATSATNRTIPPVEKIVTRSTRTNSQPETSFSVKETTLNSRTSRALSERESSVTNRTIPPVEKIATRSTREKSQVGTSSSGKAIPSTSKSSVALSKPSSSATNGNISTAEKLATRSQHAKSQAETSSTRKEIPSTSKSSVALVKPSSSATNGNLSTVEKLKRATRSQHAKSQAETSSSRKAIPSTSKSSVALSKPASAASSTKTKDGEASNSFKSPQKRPTSPNESISTLSTLSRFRPAACSSPIIASSRHLWESALRDADESNSSNQPEEQQQPIRQPNRRVFHEEEDERSWRCVSPVESVTEEDFDGVTGVSNASSTWKKFPYTQHEKNIILKYVCEENLHQFTSGNRIWRTLDDKKLIPGRTWQSLREHFLKQILPNVMENRRVSNIDKQKFERAKKIVKLGKKAAGPTNE